MRRGSRSTIARTRSAGDRRAGPTGCWPVRRTYRSTPSAYTSVAVVTCPPVTCSGAAYSGVSAAPPSRVSALASADLRLPPLGIPLEQLGDPEVEQLDLPIDPDEHVRRLDVAVHDQVGVRVGDSLQHIEEQAETGLDSQRMFAAVAVDAQTVHVLEDEIRLARRRHPRIDEVRDVRVGEPGENVAFAPEPLFAGAPQQREVQQLDRRAPFEAAVAALGQPHAAHAALTDSRDQAVGAEGLPLQRPRQRPRAAVKRPVPGNVNRGPRRARRAARSRSAPSAASRAPMDASQGARRSAAISSASSRYGLTARQRSGLSAGMRPHEVGLASAIARCR